MQRGGQDSARSETGARSRRPHRCRRNLVGEMVADPSVRRSGCLGSRLAHLCVVGGDLAGSARDHRRDGPVATDQVDDACRAASGAVRDGRTHRVLPRHRRHHHLDRAVGGGLGTRTRGQGDRRRRAGSGLAQGPAGQPARRTDRQRRVGDHLATPGQWHRDRLGRVHRRLCCRFDSRHARVGARAVVLSSSRTASGSFRGCTESPAAALVATSPRSSRVCGRRSAASSALRPS